MKFGIYRKDRTWMFDIKDESGVETPEQALALAKAEDEKAFSAQLVSETEVEHEHGRD